MEQRVYRQPSFSFTNLSDSEKTFFRAQSLFQMIDGKNRATISHGDGVDGLG